MGQLISVIVPIYNCEKYLERCIESILHQTYTDIQLILVDDGSSDDSGRICDQCASNDDRVTVIHQTNSGVSAARNAGIDILKGKYLLFVDGDDELELNAIEVALGGFSSDSIDVVIFGVKKIDVADNSACNLPIEEGMFGKNEVLRGILSDYASFGAGYPCNKIWYIGNCSEKSNIPHFDISLYYFEDLEWMVRMLRSVNEANLIPAYLYNYNIHSESVTHKSGNQERREIGYHMAIWKIIDDLNEETNIKEWFSYKYYPEIVNGVIYAWKNGFMELRELLMSRLCELSRDILQSSTICMKIKLRCRVILALHTLKIL